MSFSSFLLGSVLIECEGGYPETFLNVAAENAIPLWDIRRCDSSLWCRTHAAHYIRLRAVSRRACVRMRVRGKFGLPFHWHRLGLRSGLFAGVILFVLLLQLLSSRIWVVRIQGNDTISEEDIRAVVEPFGVCEGGSFKGVDIADLRLTALQQLPNLTWLTVNQSGSIATVEIKERSPVDPLAGNVPTNLIALRDGVIVSIDTATGQPMVRVGDAVRRGDLLISGVTDSKVGPQLKKAAGSVVARVTHTLQVTVPYEESVTVPTHTVSRPKLNLFGFSIPLYTNSTLSGSPTENTERYPLIANGVPLPIGMDVTQFTYTTTDTLTRTPQQALDEAKKLLLLQEQELQETLTIENRTEQVKELADSVTITATYSGTQELTQEVPIA